MSSDADKLLLNATPRILSELSRVMSGSGGDRVFKFPRLSPVVAEEVFLRLDLFKATVCTVVDEINPNCF